MARRKKVTEPVMVVDSSPQAGEEFNTISEIPNLEPVVEEISATPVVQEAPSVAPVTAGPEIIKVVSRVYQWEPFQKIAIFPGTPTPVELTSWVQCQLNAKVLRRG